MRRVAAALAFVLLASCAQAVADPAPYAGVWRGQYTCLQGLTDLTLTIEAPEAGQATAIFRFQYEEPDVLEMGSFRMNGTFDENTRRVSLTGAEWIEQPADYGMVDLVGTFDANYTALEGNVETAGCGTFSLTKVG
jgi:hypothetical protein